MVEYSFLDKPSGMVDGLKEASEIIPPFEKKQVQTLGQTLTTARSACTCANREPFPDLETVEELKQYLDDAAQRLKSSTFVYHYTTVSNLLKIIRSKLWHLGSARNMNDKLDYDK